jgi:hypothetical protein
VNKKGIIISVICLFILSIGLNLIAGRWAVYLNGIDGDFCKTLPLSKESKELPNKLIINPGLYNFEGVTYSLDKEGLYRFLSSQYYQRIVYKNDVDALLSSICWIAAHGTANASESTAELTKMAINSKLSINCIATSIWAKSILDSQNIKSRIVGGIKPSDPAANYNLHVIIEVWKDELNKWVVYDLDTNLSFNDKATDMPLSFIELSEAIKNNNYKIVRLSADPVVDISGYDRNGALWNELLISDGTVYGYYSNWMSEALIIYGENFDELYFTIDEKDKDAFLKEYPSVGFNDLKFNPTLKYLSKDEFKNKFYSKNNK